MKYLKILEENVLTYKGSGNRVLSKKKLENILGKLWKLLKNNSKSIYHIFVIDKLTKQDRFIEVLGKKTIGPVSRLFANIRRDIISSDWKL